MDRAKSDIQSLPVVDLEGEASQPAATTEVSTYEIRFGGRVKFILSLDFILCINIRH